MKSNYYDPPTKYADCAMSATLAVRDNGYNILTRPKYVKHIKYTLIRELDNHICFVYYLNENEEQVYGITATLRGDFPIIGEEITVNIPREYITNRSK